jgi:hypothetical protein
MKNKIDLDTQPNNQPYLFGNDEIDKSNIRVRPAEFARLIDCSKQAVSIWVKDGKITLGTDGRLNPSVAIAQLLRNSNPALLRAKALKPLLKTIKIQEKKILDLEYEVSEIKEDCDFYEGANEELINLLNNAESHLMSELANLSDKPAEEVVHAFLDWLQVARKEAVFELLITDFLPMDVGAPNK